jgi:NADPH-dependent curcumin reductase CurA
MQRRLIQGFVVLDNFDRAREAYGDLASWIHAGRLRWKDRVLDGIEAAPEALSLLFAGKHAGKIMVRIADEPS